MNKELKSGKMSKNKNRVLNFVRLVTLRYFGSFGISMS